MFKLKVKPKEWINDNTGEFISSPETVLQLEHSLISISKWEAKWKKPFLDVNSKGFSIEEFRDYIRFMTINKNVNPFVYYAITPAQFDEVKAYMGDTHTATVIRDSRKSKRGKSRIITSELIYYWMFTNNIAIECEKWHLSRLMTLIQVCFVEGRQGEKMSPREIMKQNQALNSMRKFKHGTKG